MIAGLILKDDTSNSSFLSFLGEETSCLDLGTNQEIVKKIKENEPEVLAVDSGTETGVSELTEDEEQLKDDGHSFVPTSHEKMKKRRLEALENQLFEAMGAEAPEIIRFDPRLTSRELALDSDEALESLGVETENIRSAEQFDSVLGAVTARFYQQNQYREMGVVIPEPLSSQEEISETPDS